MNRASGIALTVALSMLVLGVFFGGVFVRPATTFFTSEGDGLQMYYQTMYHLKHDTSYWKQSSTNYPHGESVFFTGAMILIANPLKALGCNSGEYATALINLSVLLSIPLAAIFLFLIFQRFSINSFFAALCANGVAFLSPQMLRVPTHYSLALFFIIPCTIYLLLRYHDQPKIKNSLWISAPVFIGAITHLYFALFSGILIGSYWFFVNCRRDNNIRKFLNSLIHFSLQLILPVLTIILLIQYSDQCNDRTKFPWGYLVYHSNNAGVFFPFGKPYESIIRKLIEPSYVEWEGLAFVGCTAIIGILFIICRLLYYLLKRQYITSISVVPSSILNAFLWASIPALYLSYALPFKNGHEEWLLKLGPLAQFRSIGRLAWLFYYVINIIVIIKLYHYLQGKSLWIRYLIWVIPIALSYDAFYQIKGIHKNIVNRLDDFSDNQFDMKQHHWMKTIDPSKYQAILPLPWFHNGSENGGSRIEDHSIVRESYISSYLLHMPILAMHGSRVSLSQTYQALPINLDPVEIPPVIERLPNNKPLLLIVQDGKLNANEIELLRYANPIANSEYYTIWEAYPSAFSLRCRNAYEKVNDEIKSLDSPTTSDNLITNIPGSYIMNTFTSENHDSTYVGKFKEYNIIFDSTMQHNGKLVISYWVKNIAADRNARTTQEITVTNNNNHSRGVYMDFASGLVAIKNEWGLIESEVTLGADENKIKITLFNLDRSHDETFEIDNLMIRQPEQNIYSQSLISVMKNNRTYTRR